MQLTVGAVAASATPAAPSATALSAPAPTLTIGPEWIRVPPQAKAAIRLERTTPAGTESLSGSREICNCHPDQLAALLALAFKQVSAIHVSISATTICNEPATNFLMTGHADTHGSASNIDEYFFRRGDSLYTLTYTFWSEQPAPGAVATLAALCPPQQK